MTTRDQPENGPISNTALTPTTRRIINASAEIVEAVPYRPDYLHTVMCQVGLPRKRTNEGSVANFGV